MEAQESQSTEPEDLPQAQPPSPRLKAGPVLAVFALYFTIQVLTGFVVGVVAALIAATQGANLKDPQTVAQITQQATPLSVIAAALLAGIITLFLSARYFSQAIKDRSLTGAAWVIGPPRSILMAFGAGILIALACLFISPLMCPPPDKDAIGPFAKMATTPGFQRIIVLIIALLLAPPIEELLFRGLIFGGFCRSFGPTSSVIITTVLFAGSHVTEAIYFWPAFVFIALMALAALWFRVKTRSIGPSIALHFSYNLILMGTTFLTS